MLIAYRKNYLFWFQQSVDICSCSKGLRLVKDPLEDIWKMLIRFNLKNVWIWMFNAFFSVYSAKREMAGIIFIFEFLHLIIELTVSKLCKNLEKKFSLYLFKTDQKLHKFGPLKCSLSSGNHLSLMNHYFNHNSKNYFKRKSCGI